MLKPDMIHLKDIRSLTEFQRTAKSRLQELKRSGRPQVLTVNGRAEIVVQDAKSYQTLLDRLERAESIAGVREGLTSMRKGEGQPAREFLERLRKKHKIPAKA
jgi:Antitoxin Phd_YefM, type II toxin-antitoxin system